MFELEKTFHFEAGHTLTHHDGKCARPHGHSYTLTVRLRSTSVAKNGPKVNMVMDFWEIARVVQPMVDIHLDHQWLNDSLKCDSPTLEFTATWVYDFLKPQLPNLYSISLMEGKFSKVTYWGKDAGSVDD